MKINATGEIKKDVENICISGEHNPEPSLLNNRKYREQGLLVHQAPWWTGLRSSKSAPVIPQMLRLPGKYPLCRILLQSRFEHCYEALVSNEVLSRKDDILVFSAKSCSFKTDASKLTRKIRHENTLNLSTVYRSVVMNQQCRLQTVGAHVEYNSVFQTLMSPASHPVILPPGIACKSSPHKWTSEEHPLLRMTVPQS